MPGLLEMLQGVLGGQGQQGMMPPAQPQPPQGSGSGFSFDPGVIAPAIAMLDPRNQQLGAVLMANNQMRKDKDESRQNQNQTVQWLKTQGMGEQEASYLASDKDALRSWYGAWKTGDKPDWKIQRLINDQGQEQDFMVDMRNPERRNPIGGAKSDVMSPEEEAQKIRVGQASRSQINIDTGVKLPTGFRWKDPDNQDLGVEPIPGGPATQLPSEAAGRIGLSDSFMENFDKIRKDVESGNVTGPVDRFRSANDSSYKGAETYRQIQTGVDSLQRMLTGAGMPISEASAYAFRYLPTYSDDAASMVTKLDRLKDELSSIKKRVTQGRGDPSPSPPEAVDYKSKYGLD